MAAVESTTVSSNGSNDVAGEPPDLVVSERVIGLVSEVSTLWLVDVGVCGWGVSAERIGGECFRGSFVSAEALFRWGLVSAGACFCRSVFVGTRTCTAPVTHGPHPAACHIGRRLRDF